MTTSKLSPTPPRPPENGPSRLPGPLIVLGAAAQRLLALDNAHAILASAAFGATPLPRDTTHHVSAP